MSFVQTEEGRILNPTGTPNYEYTLADHLGNTRVTFDSSTGTNLPKQADDYYPFGLESSVVLPGNKNNYLYNKKELQEELNQYDYGARFYDPVIARWTSVDPLADINQNISPYNYCYNDPISNIDRFGLDTGKVTNLHEVTITVTKFVQNVMETALYFQRLSSFNRAHFFEPTRVEEARNFEDMMNNATVKRASKTIIKGQLLDKLKKDPAFQAWRKKILAQYKANPQLKRYLTSLKLGGQPFFSTNGDTEVKLSVRGANLTADIQESNGSITVNYQMNDTFDLDYQAGRGPVYNGINGVLKPIWMGVLDGRDDMKVEASWNETIKE